MEKIGERNQEVKRTSHYRFLNVPIGRSSKMHWFEADYEETYDPQTGRLAKKILVPGTLKDFGEASEEDVKKYNEEIGKDIEAEKKNN